MQVKELIPIANESFYLRNLHMADVKKWYEYLQILPGIEYASWDLSTPDDLLQEITRYESSIPDSPLRLGIFQREHDSLVGTIGLNSISSRNKTAEISYEISPQYWGRGIIPLAAEALCSWAFTLGNFNRIQAAVLETNDASLRAMDKMGFEREGLLRAYRIVGNKPQNFWLFSRLNPAL